MVNRTINANDEYKPKSLERSKIRSPQTTSSTAKIPYDTKPEIMFNKGDWVI